MQHVRFPIPTGDDWLDQVFQCQAVRNGGVIRRQIIDVKREVGIGKFVAEVRRRHFRLVRTSQHFIVVCNSDPVALVV